MGLNSKGVEVCRLLKDKGERERERGTKVVGSGRDARVIVKV
jgi:hypothetical protein